MTAIVSYGIGGTEEFPEGKFGEYWLRDPFDLAWSAGYKALEESCYHRSDINLFCFAGDISSYDASKLRRMLGVKDKEICFFGGRNESGNLALNYAIRSIESGKYITALIGSSERCMGVNNNNSKNLLLKGENWEIEAAKMKMQFMNDLEVTDESLAGIPVKAHFQGSFNPTAQYQKIIKRRNVLNSPFVVKPLRSFEIPFQCCGSVAMVLCNDEEAKKHSKPVYIEGYGTAQEVDQEHTYKIPSVQKAIEQACKNVIKPSDLSLLQIQDRATPLEAIILGNMKIPLNEIEEVLKNTYKLADEPEKQISPWSYELDEPIFVNTDGGDKAAGHPGCSTAHFRRCVETVKQLRGEAGKRQVKDATHGLVLSIDDYREMSISSHLLGVR